MSAVARSRGRAAGRDHALFAVLPAIVSAFLVHEVLAGRLLAVDFRQEYWVAGMRLLHGGDLYAWSARQIADGVSFPYPPFAAVAFVPFGLLPRGLSSGLFTALCAIAGLGTLRVLSVRDWRLYGLVLLWSPVVAAWQTANLTLPLLLGIAVLWRFRDRPAVAGAVAALLVSLKPITWPIVLWLLATRRYRAGGWAIAGAAALNAAASTLLGPRVIGEYLHLSSLVTEALYRSGYGVIALTIHLGGSAATGIVIEAAVCVALAVACVVAGRRGREREALTLSIALMLTASPLVWNHYLALLIAPLAIARPRLHWTWLAPLALWACTAEGVATWQAVLAWVVSAAVIAAIVRRPRRPVVAGLRAGVPRVA